jgi:hypothetical protein
MKRMVIIANKNSINLKIIGKKTTVGYQFTATKQSLFSQPSCGRLDMQPNGNIQTKQKVREISKRSKKQVSLQRKDGTFRPQVSTNEYLTFIGISSGHAIDVYFILIFPLQKK